jgi:hypothetical protein
MSINPLRPDLNRGKEIKSTKGDLRKSITLFDIDYAMMSYLEDTVLPTLKDANGVGVKIPVIYGNSERWNGARRQGVFRDSKGKIQLPILMIRRTSIAKDETMSMPNRHLSYPAITKWSKDNRYDRFSAMGSGVKPKKEIFRITMPDYVEVNYDCLGWTSYTEQLNEVIEHLNFASSYWGDKEKFKFRTSVGEYNVVNEVGEGTERINRVEFSLNVKAYLLPEKFDGEPTTKKSMSTKRIVMATEVDLTADGRLEAILSQKSPYYDNKDLIDFLSLNNSKYLNPTSNNVATFTNTKAIKTPALLKGTINSGLTYNNEVYDIKVFVNGIRYYQTLHYSVTITNTSLTINFNPAPSGIGFIVNPQDEVIITGKFIDL